MVIMEGNDLLADLDAFLAEHEAELIDRKSTRLNSSHSQISYAVFCLKKKKTAHLPQVACPSSRTLHAPQPDPRRIHPMDDCQAAECVLGDAERCSTAVRAFHPTSGG